MVLRQKGVDMGDERRVLDVTDTVMQVREAYRSGYGPDPDRLFVSVVFCVPGDMADEFWDVIAKDLREHKIDNRF